MSKTMSRLFDNYSDAENAVRDLEAIGVSHDDISIVANNADHAHGDHDTAEDAGKGASTGALIGGAGGLLAGLGILAIPGIEPAVAKNAGAGCRIVEIAVRIMVEQPDAQHAFLPNGAFAIRFVDDFDAAIPNRRQPQYVILALDIRAQNMAALGRSVADHDIVEPRIAH
jgi:hypothetical protein